MTLKTGPPNKYFFALRQAIDLSPVEFPGKRKSVAARKYVPMLYDILIKDGYRPFNARITIIADLCTKEKWPREDVERFLPRDEK